MHPPPLPRTLHVELLALDLSACGRCAGTGAHLDEAVAQVAGRLRMEGISLDVTKTLILSEEQAIRSRFVSSPTLRIEGHDIALEHRESDCADCGSLCGCDGGVACRVWVWQGREHLEAPVPLIAEALLDAAHAPMGTEPEPEGPFHLPENLRRFFRERARQVGGDACCGASDEAPCCASRAEGPSAPCDPTVPASGRSAAHPP